LEFQALLDAMREILQLRNNSLCVAVAPTEGGRIVSLFSQQSDVEFLLQSHRPFDPVAPSPNANFGLGACAGIEECLPTVSACEVNGQTVPDHGDFWQLQWKVLSSDQENAILLTAVGFSYPLRFTKRIRLSGACLRLEYAIENCGNSSTSFLYATHPLLAIDAGDRIFLPVEVSELVVHDSKHDRLGSSGDRVSWPVCTPTTGGMPIDVGLLSNVEAGTADMLYTDRLKTGWCGLYRTQHQQGIAIRFDTDALPYLGLWICAGGWPEHGATPKQYAFAPEPTTAPCGSLADALQRGLAMSLPPGGTFSFAIEFFVTEQGTSLTQFQKFIR